MVAGVGGVNGFDLHAVGQMDYCQLWVKQFFWNCVGELSFQVDSNFTINIHFLSEESVAK